MSGHRKGSDSGNGAIAVAFLVIIAMPLFGIYLLTRNDETDKFWGIVLTALGIVLWIVFGVICS